MTEYPMRIGGEEVRTPEVRQIELPYDGSPVGTVYVASGEQVDAAVGAAAAAARVMREM
jgi:acyl-CoA reductase-like NAD-dependent aldehyde dehydrogenase